VFNLLAYLIQHRDRVVTKQELLDTLWPGRFVSEAALTSRLMVARKAVGDDGRAQRLIQTVHGRGYRFIAEVEEHVGDARGLRGSSPSAATPVPPEVQLRQVAPVFPSEHVTMPATLQASRAVRTVGREAELAQLHRHLERVLHGTRQVVFVTGEAGLGKTTLIETFIADLRGFGALWIGRGQCLEHYGAGEAYLPVLEALGRLCRESEGREFLALLAQRAPTWVVQMPWLIDDAGLEALQGGPRGSACCVSWPRPSRC
jgi:DNA-binding winged helix-turn-helix (wHTH) protein